MKSVTITPDDDTGEPQGIEIHIGHEHMQKLGMKQPPEAGTKVSLQAHGKVSSAHTEMVDGKPRHRMSVTLTRGDMAPTPAADGKRADIRGDVEAAADKVASKPAAGKPGRAA